VFHTVAWLKTLRHTYEYEPVVFRTSSPTKELKKTLYDRVDDLNFLIGFLQTTMERQNLKYLEVVQPTGISAR